jgi:hypothetical protein
MRDTLKREVAKAEEIDRRLEHISTSLDNLKIEESVSGIREDRLPALVPVYRKIS